MSESLLVKAGSNSLGGCGYSFNASVLRKPVYGFVTPQLRFHPIERALLCQTSANCFGGFATMGGHVFEFVLELFVGGFDLFFGGDAVDDKFGLDVILGAVFLTLAQGDPIDVDGAGIDALLSQGANDAFQADVHLLFDQRLGNGEVVELDQFGDYLFALKLFLAMVA